MQCIDFYKVLNSGWCQLNCFNIKANQVTDQKVSFKYIKNKSKQIQQKLKLMLWEIRTHTNFHFQLDRI